MKRLFFLFFFLFLCWTTHVFAAAPTFVQSGTGSTASGTSHSITLPGGITTGNLILVMVAVDGSPTTTIDTGVSGTNWTISAKAANGTIVSGFFIYKVAESSNALTLTTSATEITSYVVFEFSGSSGIVDGTSANGSSTNSNPASHTPAGGSKDYMWVAYRGGDATVQATVSPSGYSTLVSVSEGSGGGTTSGAAYKAATASSEDPGTFTSATEQWITWTVAIYPTEAGGTVTRAIMVE